MGVAVIINEIGFLPDSDPSVFDTAKEAVEHLQTCIIDNIDLLQGIEATRPKGDMSAGQRMSLAKNEAILLALTELEPEHLIPSIYVVDGFAYELRRVESDSATDIGAVMAANNLSDEEWDALTDEQRAILLQEFKQG